MTRGSCLCSKIRYTIDGPLGPIYHCHCVTCRKAQGSAFATVARVKVKNFKFESGKEFLTGYSSSRGKKRYFCSICGSPLYSHVEGQDEYSIRLGVLDDDPLSRPSRHIFVREKAPWYEIKDDIKQFDKWPE